MKLIDMVFQPALFGVHFYKHPEQICPFIVETVGIVKYIAHG